MPPRHSPVGRHGTGREAPPEPVLPTRPMAASQSSQVQDCRMQQRQQQRQQRRRRRRRWSDGRCSAGRGGEGVRVAGSLTLFAGAVDGDSEHQLQQPAGLLAAGRLSCRHRQDRTRSDADRTERHHTHRSYQARTAAHGGYILNNVVSGQRSHGLKLKDSGQM